MPRLPLLLLPPLLLLLLALAACGFQLRQDIALPPAYERIQLETVDPFSALGQDLGNALVRAGATLVEGERSAVLRISADHVTSAPLTVGESGRVQEYALRHRVEVELLGPDGSVAMPRQIVELSRDYTFDSSEALGSPGEEEVVREELRREMVQAILRRLQAAVR